LQLFKSIVTYYQGFDPKVFHLRSIAVDTEYRFLNM
jgi:hypothetical protein